MNGKIKEAIIKLINNKELKLFGYILYNFEFEIIETNEKIKEYNEFAYIIYDTENKNIKLQIDKYFIDTHSVEDIIVLILHNILHILNKHNLRKINYDPNIFNLAADHVINRELSQQFKLPKEFILFQQLIRKNLTTEQVYDWIQKNFEQETKLIKKDTNEKFEQPPQNYNCEQDKNNKNNKNEENSKKQLNNNIKNLENKNENNQDENNQKNNEINKENNYQKNETDFNLKENKLKCCEFKNKINNDFNLKNVDNIEQIINNDKNNQLIDSIKRNCQLLIDDPIFNPNNGNKTNNLIEYIKKIIKVEIPWYKLLEKALLLKTKINSDTRSWNNIMKRYKAHNILLPGYGVKKELDTIGLIFDTSGSISKQNLQIFASILKNTISEFDKIWMIQHDTYIKKSEIINQNDLNSIENIKFIGRGGTSHYYVFKEIEKAYLKELPEYINLNIGLLIFITDFCSDVQDYWKKFEWTKHIPVIFILTKDTYKVPKEIDENPIYIKDIIN